MNTTTNKTLLNLLISVLISVKKSGINNIFPVSSGFLFNFFFFESVCANKKKT